MTTNLNLAITKHCCPQLITKNIHYLIHLLKQYPIIDQPILIDVLAEIYHDLSSEDKENIYPLIIEKGTYNTFDEIEDEIQGYLYYSTIFSQFNHYTKKYTIQEINHLLNQDSISEITPYLMSLYIKHYKCKKESYFSNHHLKEIILGHLHHDLSLLQDKAKALMEIKEQMAHDAIDKKLHKIIQKASRKLNELITNKENLPLSEIEFHLKELKITTHQQIQQYIKKEDEVNFSYITDFFTACQMDIKIDQLPTVTKKPDAEFSSHQDIDFIEDLFNLHHLYFKKRQIQEEIDTIPELLEFFQNYLQTLDQADLVQRQAELHSLLGNIEHSKKKNTESCRRLIAMIHHDLSSFPTDKPIETVVEEKVEPLHLGPTIQIQNNKVYKNSAKKNPTTMDELKMLLHPESQERIHYLERLVFEIGYDKVKDYLTKSKNIYIEDLDTIIRTDRKLRFEFQRILEDIEMYFRSSLTYFLTNKYDKVYLGVDQNTVNIRGYLQKDLFMNNELHKQHIHQVHERINQELNNKNNQIKKEYAIYKYNLPFSTAAGIMTFGWLICFFENLNYKDRVEYLSTYYRQITPQTFLSWMNNLASLRNRCAHYHSLYRLALGKELRTIITNDHDGNAFDDDFNHSTLFYYTIVMSRLSPDCFNIEDFIDNLGVIFRKASRDNYAFDLMTDYSFPKTWRQILENEKTTKVNIMVD